MAKMPRVLVPIADGFEEIEAVTVIDVLRRGGIHVTVAGLHAQPHKGSRRIQLVPESTLSEIKEESFDMIVLPGGEGGVENLIKDGTVIEILGRMKTQGKAIAAICAAPLILKEAKLIAGSKLTSYPGLKEMLEGSDYQEESVVIDGNLITSRGPGTAMKFALALTKILIGQEKADQVAGQLLTSKPL